MPVMAVVEVTIAAVSVLCAQAGFALALAVGLARAAVRIHVHNASRLVGVRDVRRVPSKRAVVALLDVRRRSNASAQVRHAGACSASTASLSDDDWIDASSPPSEWQFARASSQLIVVATNTNLLHV